MKIFQVTWCLSPQGKMLKIYALQKAPFPISGLLSQKYCRSQSPYVTLCDDSYNKVYKDVLLWPYKNSR